MIIEDSEVLNFLTKLIFVIVLLIIGSSIYIVLVMNKNSYKISNIEESINKNESFVVLAKKKECNNCEKIESKLKKDKIKYYILDMDLDRRRDIILRKINVTNNDIVEPSIIYIEEGKVKSILVDVKKMSDLNKFLEYNNVN